LSLKVFQIAKKLGIDSKAIVRKCEDEGIAPPVEKGKAVTLEVAPPAPFWFGAACSAAQARLAA